jgi:flagellar biogenesis protein FliO
MTTMRKKVNQTPIYLHRQLGHVDIEPVMHLFYLLLAVASLIVALAIWLVYRLIRRLMRPKNSV